MQKAVNDIIHIFTTVRIWKICHWLFSSKTLTIYFLQPEKLTAMSRALMRLQGRVENIESRMEEGGISCNGIYMEY